MLKDYVKQKQQIFDEYYLSMKSDLLKIQGVSNLYQYNTNVTDYLACKYNSDLDSVYNYIKFIKPIYDYVYSSIPFIKDMKIYKSNRNVLTIPSTIVNIDTLENAKIINEITSANGIWTCEKDKNILPQIKYYQKIYTNDFFQGLGLIEIHPKPEVLRIYINNIRSILKGHTEILLIDSDNKMLYRTGKFKFIDNKFMNNKDNQNKLLLSKNTDRPMKIELNKKKLTRYTIFIKELNIKTVILEDQSFMSRHFKINWSSFILYIIGLFIALSLIYYFFTANITKRLLKLAKFMRKFDEKNISLYKGKCGNDEIGFLITSYNSMITRIDELVNIIHKEELLRKEAAYAALQAQVRPHFLFGTLESIRMLAETNKDFKVANIIFTFYY
jgi:two-component system sensor histidine kinase YesM